MHILQRENKLMRKYVQDVKRGWKLEKRSTGLDVNTVSAGGIVVQDLSAIHLPN